MNNNNNFRSNVPFMHHQPPPFPPPPLTSIPPPNMTLDQPSSRFGPPPTPHSMTMHSMDLPHNMRNIEQFAHPPPMNWANDFHSGPPNFYNQRLPPPAFLRPGFAQTTNAYSATQPMRPRVPTAMSYHRLLNNWTNDRNLVGANAFPAKPPVVDSQRDRDEKWLKNFLDNCERRIQNSKHYRKPPAERIIKISEAKELHSRACFLTKTIEELTSSNCQEIVPKRSDLKTELDTILIKLNDEITMESLAVEVKNRIKKRKRAKEKRKADFLIRKDKDDRIKEKHEELDKWLSKRCEMQQNAKQEKLVQKELDSYLQEVRLKRDKLKKSLDIVTALSKLRKARKESALRKGLPLPETHDKVFLKAHSTAKENLLTSLSIGDEEEKSLRSFLAKERKIEEDNIKKQKLEEEEEKRTEWNKNRWEVLFGSHEELDAFDVMWPIQELHKQASSTLLALANTRQQWDRFIVAHEDGSAIPTRWLEPAAPSKGWLEFSEDSENYQRTI